MCGLVVEIRDGLAGPELFGEALASLKHRGPDATGSWRSNGVQMGHQRLSILDLSPSGNQPMHDPGTGNVLAFNGEIYNFVELRTELQSLGHCFRSKSDTEVILKAYEQWGEHCVDRFNGMWAIVIWDAAKSQAFISRDRFGVKPLYYAVKPGALALASEPKALIRLWPELKVVNDDTIYRFLARGELHNREKTFFAEIQSVPAASSATWSVSEVRPRFRRYWDFPEGRDSRAGSQLLSQFDELFEDAVRLRMRSDVPVGVTLSGGLDSTAVLAAAAEQANRHEVPLHAFTSVYPAPPGTAAIDEKNWAEQAAGRHPGVQLHLVECTGEKWLDTLREIVHHLDAPSSSPAIIPLWRIMEEARNQEIPVLLEGQGADELLGGYPHHAVLALLQAGREAPRRGVRPLARQWRGSVSASSQSEVVRWLARETIPWSTTLYRRQRGLLGILDKGFARDAERRVGPLPRESRQLSMRLRSDLSDRILPSLLHYGDAVSMAHGIESRMPFMDYRLVEFVTGLPDAYKVSDGQTKRVLRAYLARKGHVAIAARRDKKGYPTPVSQWIRRGGGGDLAQLLGGSDARVRAYCDPGRLRHFLRQQLAGDRGADLALFRLLTTELWLRERE